jgi:parvulin-like peptidyl-prolyl isomerase
LKKNLKKVNRRTRGGKDSMRKQAKNLLCIVVFLFMILPCVSAFAEVVDKVIVVVNDEVITQREFDRAFLPVKKSYEANFQGEELRARLGQMKKQVLEQLINSKLTVSLAKEEELEVNEDNLKEKMDRIRAYYNSEEEFLHALSEKGTNLSEFDRDMREQMLAQELIEKEVASKIITTPAEIREVYDKNKEQLTFPQRVKVSGIMIRKAEDTESGEAKKSMEEIVRKLEKGEDFAELAREYSEGPYAERNGDMGYIAPGQMLEEIDKVIFSMKKNTVSDIVETSIGYHLFRVEDIEDPRQAELAEVSDFIRGQLYKKKFEENLIKWIKEKRKNAYISYK